MLPITSLGLLEKIFKQIKILKKVLKLYQTKFRGQNLDASDPA